MNRKRNGLRILAIDLRIQELGYAVFEGPKQLLDWGGMTYRSVDVAGRRLADLLTLCHPSALIVRKDRRTGVRNTPAVAAIVKSIKHEAAGRSIPIIVLTPEAIREAFSIFSVKNKDELASMLATEFPELLWKLPPKRKRWQHEHHRMMVFDAIALGFAYYRQNGTEAPPPE